MKKLEKEKQKNNFTKLIYKRGISLIVLIVTIIVIIILDLGQVFRHIFLRIYIFLFKLRLGVVINIKENL